MILRRSTHAFCARLARGAGSAACTFGLLAALGCGSSSEEGSAIESVTVSGAQGALTCTATPEAVPAQGMNAFSLLLSDKATGAALDGATIEVTTWMPSMSHYTEGEQVMPMGDGAYHVESVSLVMAGDWEVVYAITSGSVNDTCTFQYPIP